MDSESILQREFLEIRAKILQIAASLDRIERAEGNATSDKNFRLLEEGLNIAANKPEDSTRAEQVHMLFSRPYDTSWKERYEAEWNS